MRQYDNNAGINSVICFHLNQLGWTCVLAAAVTRCSVTLPGECSKNVLAAQTVAVLLAVH